MKAVVDHDAAMPRADSMKLRRRVAAGETLPLDADVQGAVDAAVGVLHRRGLSITEADPEWPPGTAEARILAIENAGLADLFGALRRSCSTRTSAGRASAASAGAAQISRQRMLSA